MAREHDALKAEEMSDEVLMVRPKDSPALSLSEIAQPADAPGAKAPLELSYFERQDNWVLTLHEGKAEFLGHEKYHSRVGLYREVEGGFRLEAAWFSGVSAFLERPEFWHTRVDKQFTHLLWVPVRYYGTGHLRGDSAFELDDDDGIMAVDFEPAPLGYARLVEAGAEGAFFLDGEGVWKGEMNTIHRPTPGSWDQMSFTFYVWNKGDGNANPTAGRVDGTYMIERQLDGGLTIGIDTFKRVVFDKP